MHTMWQDPRKWLKLMIRPDYNFFFFFLEFLRSSQTQGSLWRSISLVRWIWPFLSGCQSIVKPFISYLNQKLWQYLLPPSASMGTFDTGCSWSGAIVEDHRVVVPDHVFCYRPSLLSISLVRKVNLILSTIIDKFAVKI
jgi:hypothetical protein